MKRTLYTAVCLGVGAAMGVAGPVAVTPAGAKVVWIDKDDEALAGVSILNSQNPIELALLLQAEEGKTSKIVSVNRDKSSIEVLTDEKEAKLDGAMGHFPKISDDGSSAVVEIRGKKPVTVGAAWVRAAGVLQVATASKKSAKRSQVVELAAKNKLVVDEELTFEIDDLDKPNWGDHALELTLEIKRDIPEVAEFRFFDGDGKQIEVNQVGRGRGGFGKRVTVTRDFHLKRKPAKLSIEIDLWSDLEETEVPFDVKIGIGGAK